MRGEWWNISCLIPILSSNHRAPITEDIQNQASLDYIPIPRGKVGEVFISKTGIYWRKSASSMRRKDVCCKEMTLLKTLHIHSLSVHWRCETRTPNYMVNIDNPEELGS